MEIKKLGSDALPQATRLVADVFMQFEAPDYSEEGIRTFFDTAPNDPRFMHSLTMYGAYIDQALVGVIATRSEGRHIALFFVDGAHHRQGIGKSLFAAAREDCPAGEMTVNASPYAHEVYRRLGFTDTGTEQTVTGIRFIPMKYEHKAR